MRNDWLKEHLAIENAIAEISGILLSPGDTDLVKVLSIIGKAASVDRTRIIWFLGNGDKKDRHYAWCDSDAESLKPEHKISA